MKQWFPYKFGYVNIDETHIYLTNSGNWSETLEMEEKGVKRPNKLRKYRIQLYLVLCALVFGTLYLQNLLSQRVSVLLLLGFPMLFFTTKKYLQPELGPTFKIPIYKLSHIEADGSNLDLHFLNGKNEREVVFLEKLNPKGIQALQHLLNPTNTSQHLP